MRAGSRGRPPPERWDEIERLLDRALDLPPDEWPAFLDRACPDDPALRGEVEALLARRESIDGFLEGTAAEATLPPPPRAGPPEEPAGADRAESASGEAGAATKGRRIGVYRLVRLVARGGMGEVYLAERADGHFEQRVALKLLPRGWEAGEVGRRFRAERQILAGLDHPHIAKLLDGGVTDGGRPYLVMEYVEGEPVDHYCEGGQLPIQERLELFLRVADAVQHAHRSLVVHRDLKPSNVHVTDAGRVKLLDFGIAKLLEGGADAAGPVTRTGRRWMTPEYAAPEQIEGEPVTTSTDVYQLGVLLYQLLSGQRPFEREGRSLHRLERAILETEPDAPSTAVTRDPDESRPGGEPVDREAIGSTRPTRAAGLQRTLRGDLDAIVLKALRKNPAERYASVRAMSADVERYLEGRPVRAREGTLAYRTRKFLRRHRWRVVAAAAFVLLVAGYAATVTVQSARVRAALAEARVETEKAEQVSEFLASLFEASDPAEAPGSTITARELLERGVERVEALEGQPDVQAQMLDEMGRAYQSLGRYERAEPLLRRALALRESLYDEAHVDVAKSLDNVATLLQNRGRYDEAESHFRRALAVRRAVPDLAVANVDVGLNNLALLLKEKGDYAAADSFYRRSLAMKRARFGEESPQVATALHNLAALREEGGYAESAEPLYRRSLALRRARLGGEHPLVAQSLSHLAMLLIGRGDPGDAEPLVREALSIRRNVLGRDHPEVTTSLHNLATVLREEGSYEEAEALAREVLERDRRQLGDRHPYVAFSLTNLARVLLERGSADRAEPLLREALDIRRTALATGHWEISQTRSLLGEVLAGLGRHGEAERLLRESHARLLHLFGPEDHRTQRAADRLAAVGGDPAAVPPEGEGSTVSGARR